VRNALLVKRYQDDLEDIVRRRTMELERARAELVECLARASEYRDDETGSHVIRVGRYAAVIAKQLGLPSDQVAMIEQAATLHDVGKIGIPDAILLKPGKLSSEEFDFMKKHCGFGVSICSHMSSDEFSTFTSHTTCGAKIMRAGTSPLLQMAASIALTHHEKWNGTGYPLGLSGERIPIEGRITAVADVFDALSTKRPYKPAFPLDKCFAILEEQRARHFDPNVLDAFFACSDEIVEIQIAHADSQ
jgi:putative two-component system response regulator